MPVKKMRQMGKRPERKLLSQKDHVLLLHSDSVRDYPWLLNMLQSNEKITDTVLATLEPGERVVFDTMIRTIVGRAAEEWVGEEEPWDDLQDRRIKCMLCSTDNRWVFLIKNRVNAKTLNVGSTCISEFGITFGHDRKSIQQIIKERKRNLRRAQLLQLVDDPKAVENWTYDMNYPIVLPSELTLSFGKASERVDRLREEYLEGRRGDEVAVEINRALAERGNFVSVFAQYVAENKDKPFVVTKDLASWAAYNMDGYWQNKLYDNGFINWGIACRLAEPGFMKSIIPGLNQAIKVIGAEIVGIEQQKKAYLVKPLPGSEITLSCPHQPVVTNFGGIIFGQSLIEAPSSELLLQRAVIANQRSFDLVINEINAAIGKLGYYIQNRDFAADELVAYQKDVDRFVRLRLSEFAQRFLPLALGLPGIDGAAVVSYIKDMPGRRYTSGEIADIASIDQIMREKPFGA